MKSKTSILYLIIAVAALSAGYFLPDILFAAEDQKQLSDSTRLSLPSLQINDTDDDSTLEDLSVLLEDHRRISLDVGNIRDASSAHESAIEFLEWLVENNITEIDPSMLTEYTASPFLAASEGKALLLWECILTSENDEEIYMILDDRNGKILRFTALLRIDQETAEDSSIQADSTRWSAAFARYYNLTVGDCIADETEPDNSSVKVDPLDEPEPEKYITELYSADNLIFPALYSGDNNILLFIFPENSPSDIANISTDLLE